MAASSSNVVSPNVPRPIDCLGPGSVLFPVDQDPMIQAHIDQLHEAVGSIPNITIGSAGNHGGGGHGDGGPPNLGYRNTDGNAGGQGRVPVPTTARGPNPPDPPDDDDGDDEDEEESSDEENDERRRNRRSSRRKRSRDRRGNNNDRPRISRKEAEKVNVPPWPKIKKMALTMNVTSASADPDTDAWMSWLPCNFVVNPDLDLLAGSGGERFAMMDIKLASSYNLSGQVTDQIWYSPLST